MTEKYTSTDHFFKQHDEIASKVDRLNFQLGLRFSSRLTYEKLAEVVFMKDRGGESYEDTYRLGVDELIKRFLNNN